MGAVVSQITSLTIVNATVYSGADQRKHQSSEPLAFVRGIHRGPVNILHNGPLTRKKFPFDEVNICNSFQLRLKRGQMNALKEISMYYTIVFTRNIENDT